MNLNDALANLTQTATALAGTYVVVKQATAPAPATPAAAPAANQTNPTPSQNGGWFSGKSALFGIPNSVLWPIAAGLGWYLVKGRMK